MTALNASSSFLATSGSPRRRVVQLVPQHSITGLLVHAVRVIRDAHLDLVDAADAVADRAGHDVVLLRRARSQVAVVDGRQRSTHLPLLQLLDAAVDLAYSLTSAEGGGGEGQRLRLTQQ